MDNDEMTTGFILGLAIGLFLVVASILVTSTCSKNYYREVIIENGCGQYNSTTSEFELIKIKKD
jgi:hypothetical protein